MKAGALGELMMVLRAVMRQPGRAENAKGRVAGDGVRQAAKLMASAHLRAADRARSLVSFVPGHNRRLEKRSFEEVPLGLAELRRFLPATTTSKA
jgi:hypothetical protein